ncbi:MAG: hypothetical protein R2784_08080 [Saprospiraceae bacterium]
MIVGNDCQTGIVYTRTWTATDGCGNQSSASQVITIIDNIAPVISGVPGDLNLNCIDLLPRSQMLLLRIIVVFLT